MVWKRCKYAALTLLVAVSFVLPAFGNDSALIRAAEKGNLGEVRALLAKGANVNARDKDGITALMMAASGGHLDVVRVLLAQGADVNAKVNNAQTGGVDWTALSWASGHHPEVVLELLDKGADINAGWSFPGTEKQADVDRANAEINRIYKHLMSTLDPQQQKVLREEERDWIKRRDAEADRIARSTSVCCGSAYRVDYLDAMLKLIKQRTAILKDYRTPAKRPPEPVPLAPGGESAFSLTGTWSGSGSDSSGPGQMTTWVLTHTGSALTGLVTARTPLGTVVFNGTFSGSLDGTTLTFTVAIPHGGISRFPTCTAMISGTAAGVTASAINGTYSGTNSCTGPVTDGHFSLTKTDATAEVKERPTPPVPEPVPTPTPQQGQQPSGIPVQAPVVLKGARCGVGLIPAGSLVGQFEIVEFIKAADTAAGFIAVVKDVRAGNIIRLPLQIVRIIPSEVCVEAIVELLAPGQLGALEQCLVASTPQERACLQNILEQIGLGSPAPVVIPPGVTPPVPVPTPTPP